jgi:hypothetical protein
MVGTSPTVYPPVQKQSAQTPHPLQELVDRFAQHLRARHSTASVLLGQSEQHLKNFRRYLVRTPGEARPGFNLFRLLGIDRREVKTHSAMLRELLDPLGVHGQGDLFLRPILEHLWKAAGIADAPDEDHDDAWVIEAEVAFNDEQFELFGRMDLVMTNTRLGINIVIENKIDAHDQEDQLLRYSRWQNLLPAAKRKPAILVYLTPDGREPTNLSFLSATEDERNALLARLVRLSFRDNLGPLLNDALNQVESKSVHFLVEHYAQLIKEF